LQIKTETRVGLLVIGALAIFFYMTTQLGIFRLDKRNYKHQIVFFNDVSGLDKKADVKIAGVKVGWIESIELVEDHEYQAKANIMIQKKFILHSDAYAIVRQEGLLGTKYLEVIPGDPYLPDLQPGQALGKPGRPPVSVDEILHKVQTIATNVEDVTDSLREAFGGHQGRDELRTTMEHFSRAAERIADFTAVLDRTISHNENTINSILSDIRDIASDMKDTVPNLGNDLTRLSNKLESDFLPSFKNSIEKMSEVFDRDFGAITYQLEHTTDALESAAIEAKNGFKNISSIAEKIDEGKGLIGKLVNEEEAYFDLKQAVGGLKNYFAKVDNLSIVLDSHGEYMYRPAERYRYQDTKGYLDVRIHPNDDHFYIFQVVGSQKGTLKRKELLKNWYDEENRQILASDFYNFVLRDTPNEDRGSTTPIVLLPELIGRIETIERNFDQYKFGLQIGKIFKGVAFRLGLFENTVGCGVDIEIPFGTDAFRWVTSLEIFDVRGRDRINDQNPHLKWINRVFILRNFYMAFGADDFVSRFNANGFFGVGLRFSDDDLKYVASKLGFFGSTTG
jgi:phospholipid/cholesterol/gamma-HCH transport system substrate-binding protein